MALYVHPDPGHIVMCDFSGFQAPEMVKKRPVIVVSPRTRTGAEVCTVVPFSTAKPKVLRPCHVQLSAASLPTRLQSKDNWAKCDMVTTVALARLDRIYNGRDGNGKRQFVIGVATAEDLAKIQAAIAQWLKLK